MHRIAFLFLILIAPLSFLAAPAKAADPALRGMIKCTAMLNIHNLREEEQRALAVLIPAWGKARMDQNSLHELRPVGRLITYAGAPWKTGTQNRGTS